jgi:hypothetical protein
VVKGAGGFLQGFAHKVEIVHGVHRVGGIRLMVTVGIIL